MLDSSGRKNIKCPLEKKQTDSKQTGSLRLEKSFRTQLCYELKGIGIYKENHILICHFNGDGYNTLSQFFPPI